jgi:uncharacterized damage-inducible protein DinB
MNRVVRASIAAIVCALVSSSASAQAPGGFKGPYDIVKGYITKAAEQVPAASYSFKPVPEVRSMGQLFGHIANANFMICSTSSGEKSTATGDAEKLTSKADIQKALAASFAFCDKAWASVTSANADQKVDIFGMPHTRASGLSFNTAHDWEHYGNIVTYMRLKGMTPPSSQGGGGN